MIFKIHESLLKAEKACKISMTSSDKMEMSIKHSKLTPKLLDYFFKNEQVLIAEILKIAEPNKEYEFATITMVNRQFDITTMVIKILPKQKWFFNFFEEDEASIDYLLIKNQGCY